MPRAVRQLRGEDVLVVAAWLSSHWRLHEGQVWQRLRDGGGEAQGVPRLGGDPEAQVQLLQTPDGARPGLLRGLAQFLRPQPRDRLLWHPRPHLQPNVPRHRRMRPPLLRQRPQHQDWEEEGEVPLHLPLVLLRQLSGVRSSLRRAHLQISAPAFFFPSAKCKKDCSGPRNKGSGGRRHKGVWAACPRHPLGLASRDVLSTRDGSLA